MCRLGFLVDYLSHAAIVGFMGGAAIVIGLQQLKGLLGISHFTAKTDVVSVLGAVLRSFHHPVSFQIGVFCNALSFYNNATHIDFRAHLFRIQMCLETSNACELLIIL